MSERGPDADVPGFLARVNAELEQALADVGDLEARVALLKTDIGRLRLATAEASARLDRIEDRLDLVEGPPA